MSEILRVQNVSKTYEDNAVKALCNASFDVHEGGADLCYRTKRLRKKYAAALYKPHD